MNSPYLSVGEVALFLRKSEKWVYQHKEKIPGYFRLAGSIFFDREILPANLKEKASRPTVRKSRPDDRHGIT